MNIANTLTDQIFTHCVKLIGNETNQKKFQSKVIDPLVNYFKYKLRIFSVIIIVLLSIIIITNILMVSYVIGLKTTILSLHTVQ